jgi:hypothetical protein
VKLTSAGLPEVARATSGAASPAVSAGSGERVLASHRRERSPDELGQASAMVAAAGAALSILVLSSLVLVSLASAEPSFLSPEAKIGSNPGWLAGPLGPLTSGLDVHGTNLDTAFTVLLGLMYVSYVVILAAASHVNRRWALAALVAVNVIFFLSPPLNLTDVFNYVNYARMEVVHGLNPYTTIPSLEPHTDPTFLLSNWHGLLSPYGPLFTLFTLALVPLGVIASFWVIKGCLMALSLGIVWLVWRCAQLLGRDPLPAALFVGMNPLVLFWGLGGDHNDFFMVFLIVLAVYLVLRAEHGPASRRSVAEGGADWSALGRAREPRAAPSAGAPSASKPAPWRELGGGAAIAAAVAIKASAAILVPIFVFGAVRRTRVTIGLLVGGIAAAVATLIAFGAHLPNITQQASLVDRQSIPNIIGYLVGLGGESSGLHSVCTVVLVVGVLGCALWAGRTRDWITTSGYATLLVLLTLSWTLPSYVLWLLPFSALASGRSLRIATIVFGVYVFLFWMPYSTSLLSSLDVHLTSTTLAHELANKQHALQF